MNHTETVFHDIAVLVNVAKQNDEILTAFKEKE